jgi:integrase
MRRFERDLFPHIGKTELNAITPAQLLAALRKVEARGALETAHRLLQDCGRVWRYAVATSRADRDITGDLRGALPPSKETHLGALTKPNEVGALLRNIEEYKGSEVVRFALRLAAYVFVRPGNLRCAEWSEFDFEKKEWCIPAKKMKADREHITSLSSQVVEILEELKKITGEGQYLFPSPRSVTRPLSDVALLAALRRMGYTKEEMTAHGFRSLASTNLEQLGYDVRTIEIQLAHSDQNEIRAAYKRDVSRLQLEQRREMMQHWANWLDDAKAGAKIIPLRQVLA